MGRDADAHPARRRTRYARGAARAARPRRRRARGPRREEGGGGSVVRSRVLLLAATIAFAAFASGVAAQYPEKPVRIIVPFSPGGGSDLTSRVLSQRLTEAFGRQVVVENRPGGAGNIGTEMVARAPADGHTLLLATIS